MPKNSFILQARLNTIVAKLTDAQAGVLFKSILNYAENGAQASFDDSGVAMAFEFVKQDIDYNNAKYAEVCARNANNGKKGGAPKGNHNAQKQPKTSETTQNKRPLEKQPKTSETIETTQNKHNDTDIDNDIVIDSNSLELFKKEKESKEKEKSPRFKKPTVEELSAFCKANNLLNVDIQRFIDYYESKGWKVGNAPMKSWQAAARNWERMQRERKGAQENGIDYNKQNADTSKYDRIAGHKVYG